MGRQRAWVLKPHSDLGGKGGGSRLTPQMFTALQALSGALRDFHQRPCCPQGAYRQRENDITASPPGVVSSVLAADPMPGRKPHTHSAPQGGRLVAGELRTLPVSEEGVMLTFHLNSSSSIKTGPRQGHAAPAPGATAAARATDHVGPAGFQTISLPGRFPTSPSAHLCAEGHSHLPRAMASLSSVCGASDSMAASAFLVGWRVACSL